MKWKTVAAVSALTMSMSMVAMGASIKVGTETVVLPDEVKVFDAHHVKTPKGEVDLLSKENVATLNQLMKAVLQEQMKTLGHSELGTTIPEETFGIEGIYQLVGENEQGRHVALVTVDKVTAERAKYDEHLRASLYPTMKPFYEPPKTYTPDGYHRWTLEESKYQLTYHRGESVMEKMKEKAKHDANHMMSLKGIDESKLPSTPKVKALQEQYKVANEAMIDSLQLKFTHTQPGKSIRFHGHKAMTNGVRGYMNVDGYKLAGGVKHYTIFMPDHMLDVTLLTMDPSYTYWSRIMDQAMQGGTK